MDLGLALLMLLEAAEVGLKILVYGPKRFWSSGLFGAGKTFEQWENRTALVIMGSALLAWIITRGSAEARGFGFSQEADLHRVLLVLPTLRLFFTLKQARRIPFVLIPLRSYLGAVVVLMFIFNFISYQSRLFDYRSSKRAAGD